MRIIKACGLSLLLAGSVLANTVAAEEMDGKALYTAKNCHTCHGADGNTPIAPIYPKLAGQVEQYLTAQSIDIRDGKRTNGASMAMKALVATVTDDEFKAISKWLAGLK